MFFGRDLDDACQFISGQFAWVLGDMAEESKVRAVDALRASMSGHVTDDGVFYDSSSWLIQAAAAS